MDSPIELILIPAIGAGHLFSAVEMAKLLVETDTRVSVTVLLLKLPFDFAVNPNAESLSASTESVKFVDLPRDDPPTGSTLQSFLGTFYETQTPHVREAVGKILSGGSARVAGFLLDMVGSALMDVADEFGIPSYVFFTCGAGFLCLTFHLLGAGIEDEAVVPGFANPIPETALPTLVLDKAWASLFSDIQRGIAKCKGVLVNTFEELEPGMIEALSSSGFSPVYPVGPLINLTPKDSGGEIMEWLDGQPASSVVFLCFGSMGSFGGDQVREIAIALERTGVRFLWSLRRPGHDNMALPNPSDYENPAEVLPEGFLERTAGIGKVVGWVPQVAVLGHVAVGGFVSHCGWNSVLESVWFGVPVATWPLYAEQHLNAFEMAMELGLAADISLDTRLDFFTDKDTGESVVKAEKIERGIEKLIERDSDVTKKVKDMSDKSRKALISGGSSHRALLSFIKDVMES